jgi:hypothetical protein
MNNKDIPDWAFKKAAELSGGKIFADKKTQTDWAFAKYISEHEKPPIDKDILIARKLLIEEYPKRGHHSVCKSIEGGFWDDGGYIKAIVRALKGDFEELT